MTIRNLDALFGPKSVAVAGASKTPGSLGAVLARNLYNSGFDGPIMPVNPRHESVEGVLTYPDASALPLVPDLAVIATPPASVPGLVASFAERGARAAVVITAGFGERNTDGPALRRAMLDAARPHTMRIAGPNCLGVMVSGIGLNASFAHCAPRTGGLAVVAQSGAVLASLLDWAATRGIGFSHCVSLGDMCDVDFGDMLDYLATEVGVRAVLLYVEAVTQARKFMSAARRAARIKPVVVVKAGRYAAGARAAASHTGALAGLDAAYDAAFRRAGMLRVVDTGELFDAVETLAMARPVQGDRLAILTNGGGFGVLATDSLMDEGGRLADLAPETVKRLDAVLPPTWSHGNPVDIIGDAPGARYAESLDIMLEDPGADAILAINCPTAIASGTEAAQAVVDTVGDSRRCVLTSWVGGEGARGARRIFAERGLPHYDTPDRAVRAFMHIVNYRRNQESLAETPPSIPEEFSPDTEAARQVIDTALADGREWLTEPEAKAVMAAYAIPVVPAQAAPDPEAAARVAARLATPVALKILSRDITHKSDVGGVLLDLRAPAAVREAAEGMLDRIRAARPDARLDGFTVQPMIVRPGAFELIVGVVEDRQFGPLVLFGHGGTGVEVIDDSALALPPLNMTLARQTIARTRVHRLLKGYRDRPAAALDDVALTLIKVSQLVIDLAEIVELDINPVLADEFGVIALDARIRVGVAAGPAAARLAIRPYPGELEESVRLDDGAELFLRPVRPEDEPAFQELFSRLSADAVRFRFFGPMKVLTHPFAARMTQIDYDREMALVLTEPGAAGAVPVHAVVHIAADPNGERAEYAIMVRTDMSGRGMGSLLMERIIAYATSRGLKEIFGEVLSTNARMLKICNRFGFTRHRNPDDAGVVEVRLTLQDPETRVNRAPEASVAAGRANRSRRGGKANEAPGQPTAEEDRTAGNDRPDDQAATGPK